MEQKASVFETLNAVNVNGHTEKKNNLTYLSWAWAWAEIKKAFPEAFYTIYENKDGWNYHTDGRTAWVKTGVTIEGIENIEYLPVMDFKNKSIPLEQITSFDVNKAIQRSLTKACARHGLGLYIYAGEDLPEAEQTPIERPVKDAAIEAGLLRTQILTVAEGDLDRVNDYIKRYTNGMYTNMDDLNVDQLRTIKVNITKAKQNASK
jgi:hypothetical protein